MFKCLYIADYCRYLSMLLAVVDRHSSQYCCMVRVSVVLLQA
jgi:hypothetical protein